MPRSLSRHDSSLFVWRCPSSTHAISSTTPCHQCMAYTKRSHSTEETEGRERAMSLWVEGGQQWRPSSYAAADRSRLRHGEGLLSRLHLLLPPPDFPPPRKGETSEGWEDPSSPSELPIHFASHRPARFGEHIGAARRQRHVTFSFWATRRCKWHSQEKKSLAAQPNSLARAHRRDAAVLTAS